MAKLNEIVKFLNSELRIKRIRDSSRNGLQLKGKSDIRKIGFAVDACSTTFKMAAKQGCDMVIVHHGLLWKPMKRAITLPFRMRILRKNRMSLYAAHLPLDENTKYGNNMGLAKMLGIADIEKFGKYHGFALGYKGVFRKATALSTIAGMLNNKLKTRCRILGFGKKSVKTIGIVSGGGRDCIPEAFKDKIGCFITGEISHSDLSTIRDLEMNVIVAGHYATETVGVKSLMQPLREKFNIQTVFIDDPTGF